MEFKKGDLYIHFTKYGGVNKGMVKDIHKATNYDTVTATAYEKYSLININDVMISLNGEDGKVYKVSAELSEQEVSDIVETLKKVRDIKDVRIVM